MDFTKEQLHGFYQTMVTCRAFESRVSELFAAGKIPGFVHLSLGQEAIAAGVFACLEKTDKIGLHHRSHGEMIARGGNINEMMAELFGKATGTCKGKGGSMHLAEMKLGLLGANGILGAGYAIAAGAAFAAKYNGTNDITVCMFGDGQSNRGPIHESLNVSALWKLPIVWICENNGFGLSNPVEKHLCTDNVSDRASGYGIPGVTVDGNDVLAVYEATLEAVNRARRGDGPSLLEFKTWRWHGHFEGDPSIYKNPKDQEEWLKKDPIARFGDMLIKQGYATQADLDNMKAIAEAKIDEAVKFAEESPWPDVSELCTDVYDRAL
ncbi:MAG: thiamine pyrophosphate-dependent dehydrogenase E1 component subunit alpha [Syntrophomonadaceae bacterium]|jgi:TPP-dependent pyruvate/acetoin dehydrogenase alpha subunit